MTVYLRVDLETGIRGGEWVMGEEMGKEKTPTPGS
jgi:hypothetical protein